MYPPITALRKIIITTAVITCVTLWSQRISGQANIDSLESILDTTNDDLVEAHVAVELAKLYLRSDIDKTKYYAGYALGLNSVSDSLRIEANDQMARHFFFKSALDSAYYFFISAQNIAEESGRDDMSAALGNSIGAVLLRQSRYEDAIEVLTSSATYFESVDKITNAARSYTNIAAAHAELGNYNEAIKYSQDAIKIFKDNNLDQFTLIALPNLATQYIQNGDTLNGIKHFLEAEAFATAKNNKRSLAITYNNLGDLYLSIHEFDKAEQYLDKSIALKKDLQILKGIDKAYHNLGYVHAANGKHDLALKYYEKAIETSDVQSLADIYDKMSQSYKEIGQLSNALLYSEKYSSIKDSLTQITNIKNFAEISEKYESAKKENEILQLEADNKNLEIVKNRNRSLLLGALGTILALMILGYSYVKNQARKRIIERQQNKIDQQRMLDDLKAQELDTIDRVIEGQEEERHRIASDLHDSLGSKMATLKLYMDNFDEGDPAVRAEMVSKAQDLANITYNEVRDLSHNIQSGVRIEKGLIPALREFAAFVNSTNTLEVDVVDIDVTVPLDNRVEIQLLRIIQELVTNTIKHADADKLMIQITEHDDSLNIIVEDDGKGFDPMQASQGIGIKNIEARIQKINAEFQIDASVDNGTTALINLPL